MPHMKHLDRSCRGCFLPNRIVHLIFAVAFSVQQEANLLSELFRYIRDRATVGHVFERPNGGDDAIELLFSLLEAALPLDVPRDFVQVIESPR